MKAKAGSAKIGNVIRVLAKYSPLEAAVILQLNMSVC